MAKFIGNRCIPTPEGKWDKTKEYLGLSVVLDEKTGDSYTSKKVVPAGTELTNKDYWALSGQYNAQMALIKLQLEAMQNIPEGGTTADAALENIRIGADGTEYATPGDAVRGQVGALSEEIDNIEAKQYTDNITLNKFIYDCKVKIKNENIVNINIEFFSYTNTAFRVYKYYSDDTSNRVQNAKSNNYYEQDKLFVYVDDDLEIYMILDWSVINTTLNGRFNNVAYSDNVLFDGKMYPNDKYVIIYPVINKNTLYGQMELRNAIRGIYFTDNYKICISNGNQNAYVITLYNNNETTKIFQQSFTKEFDGLIELGDYGYLDIDTTIITSAFISPTSIQKFGWEDNGYLYTRVYSKPTFYCGKNRALNTLKAGIEKAEKYMDATLYVDSGVYDLVEEFGADYFNSLVASSTLSGLKLKNRIHIIFSPNSKVVHHYKGSNQYALSLFSPFNAGMYGGTIENLDLECSRCRYGIHDERNGATEQYKSMYVNCKLKFDNSIVNESWAYIAVIGGGFGSNSEVIYDNCILELTKKENRVGYYHQSNDTSNSDHAFIFRMNNCYCVNGSFGVNVQRSDATKISKIIVTGNSFADAGGCDSQGFYTNDMVGTNCEYHAWNNEKRSN